MKVRARAVKCKMNTDRLRVIYRQAGVQVLEFNPFHLRIVGHSRSIDYWPSTGRAWVVGERRRATFMAPDEVVKEVLYY